MPQLVIALIITVLVIISFAVQVIPLPLTAMLGALAMVVFGIIEPADAISAFGSDTVMMVAGVIIIGNAIFETGLAEKLGASILNLPIIGGKEKRLLLIVMIIITMLSAFVSNTAAVAMFLPLVASIAQSSNGKIKKKNCYMAMGIASVVGGFCTQSGSTPQMVAQEILLETDGLRGLTFFELTKIGILIAIVMFIYFLTVGYRLQERCFNFPEVPNTSTTQQTVSQSTWKQVVSGLILVGCVIGFISGVLSFGIISLLSACACILTGCISQKRVFETMDWSTIIVLGGSIGFANGMEESGAVNLIGDALVNSFGQNGENVLLVFGMIILLTALLSNVMSNTATVAVLAPLGINVALKMGADPITFVIGIIIASNLAFATPIGTPPMTMVLIGGYRFSDYVKVGGLFNIIAVVVTIFAVPLLYGF
ncbi:SLC13 family permease [Flavonifractor plautii]|uniref:SLC13 family permease n=1 Tax=Flavonifractor plautii TaxID=292800 RepID=UPI00195CE3C0|nr:SLC13 family permease [Flavonifractor plautii]MBM6664952.1 SLC13/DASS family transporter [Flavonifractor plautii]